MARISTYALDAKPDLGDKVLGTDTNNGEGLVTKNYSLREMINMFNSTNSVAVAGQMIFRFQSDQLELPQNDREPGTISFQYGIGVGTNFADIGELYISIKNSGGKRILELLQAVSKDRIILCQADDVNNFGVFKVDSLVASQLEPEFYIATLIPISDMVNGALVKDKHYALAEHSKQDAFEVWDQSSTSSVWTITHTLDKKPSVTVVDSADNKVYGKVDYIDNNTLTITFNAVFSGKAYLN
tara:strand:+ start:1779 stop:2504 length:726 start_codon:yes stop_codon:yes gene_type:complete